MGVRNLWRLLHKYGHSPSYCNKRLAIDTSIWLHRYYKLPRSILYYSLIKKIIKLLFYNISPIFVFDGNIPELKKRIVKRNKTFKLESFCKWCGVKSNVCSHGREVDFKEVEDIVKSKKEIKWGDDYISESNEEIDEHIEIYETERFKKLNDTKKLMNLINMRENRGKTPQYDNSSMESFSISQMENLKKRNNVCKLILDIEAEREKRVMSNSKIKYSYKKNKRIKKYYEFESEEEEIEDKTEESDIFSDDNKEWDIKIDKIEEESESENNKDIKYGIYNNKEIEEIEDNKLLNNNKEIEEESENKEELRDELKEEEEINKEIEDNKLLNNKILNNKIKDNNKINKEIEEDNKIINNNKINKDKEEEIEEDNKILNNIKDNNKIINNIKEEEEIKEDNKILNNNKINKEIEDNNKINNIKDNKIEYKFKDKIEENIIKGREISLNESTVIMKEILKVFKIPYVQSPMESDGQCVYLEQQGLVEGIISEDNDIFLYGGRRVFTNFFKNKEIKEYNMDDIEKEYKREDLIKLSYYLGSDYTLGIKNIGIKKAQSFIKEENKTQEYKKIKDIYDYPIVKNIKEIEIIKGIPDIKDIENFINKNIYDKNKREELIFLYQESIKK